MTQTGPTRTDHMATPSSGPPPPGAQQHRPFRTDPDGDGTRAAVLALGADRCSIAGTLEALGDTWSILVLRELFFGVRRFNDLQRDLGISRSVLSARLARLVELGVVRVVPYQEPGDRARNEYRLTRKGVDLLPVMVSLMSWGDRHLNDGDGPDQPARPGDGRDRRARAADAVRASRRPARDGAAGQPMRHPCG